MLPIPEAALKFRLLMNADFISNCKFISYWVGGLKSNVILGSFQFDEFWVKHLTFDNTTSGMRIHQKVATWQAPAAKSGRGPKDW